MKLTYLFSMAAATVALAACNSEKGGNDAVVNSGDTATVEAVKPPANGDWSTIVAPTSEGGFRMGNPDAKVKLVEFGSLTCPHCREFDETGVQPLIDKYVKSGNVSYEFRNFVRDPYDIAASLIARCNGATSFFPLLRAMYKDQPDWISKIQQVPEAQVRQVTQLGPDKQFLEIAKLAGLQQWAAMRGVPSAKSAACLTDQDKVNQLVQMNSDATNEYSIPGTPSFLINGKLVEQAAGWPALEPKLRDALGS